MEDFLGWCKKKNLNPHMEEVEAQPADTDAQPAKGPVKTESGSAKRASVRSHAYPPLYGRGQYPKEYFRPIAADAVTYQDIEKK